ncbi:MAG: hypothetical protein D3926_14590 [Desulfobacteraceae bacterium]|nr:MAG: hypothetical protein D3926_14590 [Desulfobacteraceae bacterium]
MESTIIHLNIADFAVAVERCAQPGLKRRPLIIAPPGAARAVVYDMSEEAFQQGVRKGMPLGRATRICRDATVLPPMTQRYELAMRDLIKRTLAYSPRVESGSDDGHLFVDVTGTSRLFGPPVDVAWRLNREMKKDFSLDPVWSVASNKLVAKVATRLVKPVGEYIVGAGEEQSFLSPLPLGLIPGFSPKDLVRFKEFNLTRVSQVRALDAHQLEIVFATRATLIFELVRGVDRSPVLTAHEDQTIQEDYEFADDTNRASVLKQALYLMIERVCRRLRSMSRHSAGMRLILFYTDGIRHDGNLRLHTPTDTDMQMFEACQVLLAKTWKRRTRIRHMRLICTRTTPCQTQMSLFPADPKPARQQGLIAAMDRIRDRFGDNAVMPALALPA